jgi:hypothetical protein
MRRILLLLVLAAMMAMALAVTAGPVLAADTPTQTPTVGQNCNGKSASDFVKGQGGYPYSSHDRDPNTDSFNGPVTSGLAQSPPSDFDFFDSTKPNAISAFQESLSDLKGAANCEQIRNA